MNTKVDAFMERQTKWRSEMKKLREIALECGLDEDLKWGKPCYSFHGGNIIIIQGFNDYCALLFVKGSLLDDPEQVLVQMTENTQAARQIRFNDETEIIDKRDIIKEYITNAIDVEEKGLKVQFRDVDEYEIPVELQDAIDASPEFREAFESLTPGRQKGYIIHFSSAKQSNTRKARIERAREKIYNGKGYNEQ